MLEPSGGQVLVGGRDTRSWHKTTLRRQTGYVLQDVGLFPHMTVARNVGLVPGLANWPRERIEARTGELLELVGLPPHEFAARWPGELSGGQRQRVGVARALAADPPVILMDEPFGALDVITRADVQNEFARLVRDLGKTAVFVTQDLREAMRLGSRIALMEAGRIVFFGPPEQFRLSHQPLAKAFLQTIE